MPKKTQHIRAILIDPFEEKVRELNLNNDLQTIYETIGCELITITGMTRKDCQLDLILDDEGLLKNPETQRYFKYKLFSQPFAGRALITCSDRGGNCASVPAHVSAAEIEQDIIWYKPQQKELDATMEVKVYPL